MIVLPQGAGGVLGDAYATAAPYQGSGDIWYVATGGTDAASPAGKDRQKPLATIGQAHTNAANGDTIVLMDGYAETRTTQLSITKSLVISGEGTAGGVPTARLSSNSAAAGLLQFVGVCYIRNVYFPTNIQSNNFVGGKIQIVSTNNCQIVGCYFECGPNDQTCAVEVQAGTVGFRAENSTWISIATSVATRPVSGLKVTSTSSHTNIVGCIFDDGTVGFSTASCDLGNGVQTNLSLLNNSLLLGADLLIGSSSTYRIAGLTATGGGRIVA